MKDQIMLGKRRGRDCKVKSLVFEKQHKWNLNPVILVIMKFMWICDMKKSSLCNMPNLFQGSIPDQWA